MKPLTKSELAALLYDIEMCDEDYFAIYGKERPSFDQLSWHHQDDYYHRANLILKEHRVGRIGK